MRGTVLKVCIVLVAVLALSLGAGLVWGRFTSTAQAESQPSPLAQQMSNAECLTCHSAPDQIYTFPNGDTISVSVDPAVYGNGVHQSLDCQVCHTDITGYPHREVTANSAREYTNQFADTCEQCHAAQANEFMDSVHAQVVESGNLNAPVCSDCHDPHAQEPIAMDEEGEPLPEERAHIANTCAQCHSTVVQEFRDSVHGAGVFDENNPDVPSCESCHGIHEIVEATTAEFRLNSPNLCADCHTDESIMSKYGISTNVLDTYVSDFHGTTVTLFQKTSPEHATNKAVCYDCHGVHNILAVSDPQKGLQVKENMLAACQRCHPDASENFSASWMSHYIPDPQRTPLVYYVELFYRIFVPGVLGGMAVFVVADIYGKFRNRGKHAGHSTGSKEE